jgi:hypothetical protein
MGSAAAKGCASSLSLSGTDGQAQKMKTLEPGRD